MQQGLAVNMYLCYQLLYILLEMYKAAKSWLPCYITLKSKINKEEELA